MPSIRREVTGRRRLGVTAPPAETTLAGDLLPGAEKISEYTGIPVRQVFYQLQRGFLPAVKLGRLWVGSKKRLRAHFNGEV